MSFVPQYEDIVADGASPHRTVFILHGVFGRGGNWNLFARRLVQQAPSWKAVLVHLRNHGSSRDAPEPHTLEACAADLDRVAAAEGGTPDAVIGHSFGGKVALAWLRDSDHPVPVTWVLDSPSGAGPASGGEPAQSEVGRVILALHELPMPIVRRSLANEYLREMGLSPAVAAWMATNLEPAPAGGYDWHFDLLAVDAMLRDYWTQDLTHVLEDPPDGSQVHVVRASDSDRWALDDLRTLASLASSPRTLVHELPDAGHWLHVDNPSGLLQILGAYGFGS